MRKPKLNIKLLEKVKAHILEEPRRLNMAIFTNHIPFPGGPPCGTTACIAGWAALLGGLGENRDPAGNFQQEHVAELLGISEEQLHNLFYHWGWPNEFGPRYESARTPKTRARIAAERIELFIKEGR